jgi:hypothetical protein
VRNGGTDAGLCTNASAGCGSIGYAIGQAASGDEIRVGIGSYTGDLSISNNLTINANGSATVFVIGTVRVASGTVVIRNLTVMPNGTQDHGVEVDTSAALSMSGVIVRGFRFNGVHVLTSGLVSIADSEIRSNGGDGIRSENLRQANVVLTRSVVSGSGDDGLQLNGALGPGQATLTIEDSKFEDNAQAGIQLEGFGGRVLIRGTCVRQSRGEAGIYLNGTDPSLVTVTGNNITTNACAAHVTPSSTPAHVMSNNWWGVAGD